MAKAKTLEEYALQRIDELEDETTRQAVKIEGLLGDLEEMGEKLNKIVDFIRRNAKNEYNEYVGSNVVKFRETLYAENYRSDKADYDMLTEILKGGE